MIFTATLFRPHVGTVFSIPLPDNPEAALQLESVADGAVESDGNHEFSLFFTDTFSASLPQGTYMLRHARLGEQFIFLVPIARTANGHRYQACFSARD